MYQNQDSTKTAQFSTEPLNVSRSDGSWVPVNTTATKTSSGGYAVADHPLAPKFAATSGSSSGDYQVSSSSYTVSFSLEGAKPRPATRASAVDRTASGGDSDSSVAYTGVAAGEDLAYEVTAGQVKETLVLNQAPTEANPSWTWKVHAPGLQLGRDQFGDVTFTDVLGNVVFITPIPAMVDSSAVPGVSGAAVTNVPVSLAQVSDDDWTMTLTPDATWLNDPSRVYPVFVDPSTASPYADDAHSYESTGSQLTGVAYVGNSRASGDTMWRTVTHFNYEQLFGYQVLGVNLEEWYGGDGSTDATNAWVFWANAMSFNGQGTTLSPITVSSGTSGYGVANDARLTNQYATWVNNRTSGAYLMLTGQETPGAYTYKSLGLQMFISYESKPTIAASTVSVADPNGFAATSSSPQGGAVGSSTPTLATTTTQDTSNGSAPVNRWYSVSANANMSSPLWQSGWTSSSQVQVPPGMLAPGATYYWQAAVQDQYGTTGSSSIYSWKTSTNPTPGAGATTPSDNSVVATTTPTLTAPAATATNGKPLQYVMRLASGQDGATGQVVLSQVLTPVGGVLTWTVPANVLQDNTGYTWSLVVNDVYDDWAASVQRIVVNRRVTTSGPAPTDTAGPVTVNLANGNASTSVPTPTVNTVGGPMGFQLTYNSEQVSNAGLTSHYYNLDPNNLTPSYNPLPAGAKVALVQTDSQIADNWGQLDSPAPGVNQSNYQVQWTGFINPPAGSYAFGFQSDDGAELTLNTTPVITDQWTAHQAQGTPQFETAASQVLVVAADGTAKLGGATVPLPLPITVNYFQRSGEASVSLSVESTIAPANPQLVPANWFTHTNPPLPDGWAASAPIVGAAGQYVSLKTSGSSVTVTDSAGGTHVYTKAAGAGGYTPPAGERSTLTTDTTGAFTLTAEDGTVYLFNTAGKLTSATPPVDAGSKPATPIPSYVSNSSLDNALRSLSDPLSNTGTASAPSYQRAAYFAYKGEQYSNLGIPANAGITATGPVCQTPSGTGWAAAPDQMMCAIVYPDGTTTQLEYTSTGQLGGVLNPGGALTLFSYQAVGGSNLLSAVSTSLQTDWSALHTSSPRPVTAIGYDTSGRATSVKLAALGSDPQPSKTYTYSSAPTATQDGISFVDVAGLTPPAGGPGHELKVTYNTALQKTTSTTASGLISKTLWNSHDNVLATLDAQGHESSTVYDTQDRAVATYGPAPAACFGATAALPFGPSTLDANGTADPADAPIPTGTCPAMNGTAIATSTSTYDGTLHGLNATWYNNSNLAGPPAAYSLSVPAAASTPATPENNGAISHDWGTTNGASTTVSPITGPTGTVVGGSTGINWTAQFTGLLTFPSTANYTLYTYADDGTMLWVNDKLVINTWGGGSARYSAGYTIPATLGQTVRIRLAYQQMTAQAHLELDWTTGAALPTAPANNVAIPGADLSPAYNLVTKTSTADSAPTGVAGVSNANVPAASTATTYSNPWFGTVASTSVDSAGLNLTSTSTTEAPGTGYLRQLTSTKPAGAATKSTTAYYGGTSTPTVSYGTALGVSSPICGVPVNTPQYGLTASATGPTPATGVARTAKYVYDVMGRVAATLNPGDTTWACTTYDSRGRIASQTFPAFGGSPARTVTNKYTSDGTATGDPLTSSVSDASGTITSTIGIDGQRLTYTDVSGTVTTTSYNQAMQTVSATAKLADGTTHTEAYTYNGDGQALTVSEDSKTIAQNTYTGGVLTGVAYPSGAGNAGNGTSGTLGYAPTGAASSLVWSLAGGATLSDSHVLSQTGRIVQDTIVDGAATYTSTYGYDGAGRLTSAKVPYNQLTYSYAATGGCGANTTAGADGDRTGMTDITTAPGASTPNPTLSMGYCYDNTDRLTADTVSGAPTSPDIVLGTALTSTGATPNLVYDSHGNITKLATETLAYDDTNRHMNTTLSDGTTIVYKRDATDRIISVTQTPAGGSATVTNYAYAGGGDAAAFTLTSANHVQEQTLSLPGGASVSIQSSTQVWSYAGLSGHVIATADAAGTRVGGIFLTDPYGDPIDPATGCIGTTTADTNGPANTTTPNVSNGYEGQHGKGMLTLGGLDTIEMGARQYVPLLGLFLSVDPVPGGNANDYTYPNDPVNSNDLTGNYSFRLSDYGTTTPIVGSTARTAYSPHVNRGIKASSYRATRPLSSYSMPELLAKYNGKQAILNHEPPAPEWVKKVGVGAGASLCALACVNVDVGADGHGRVGLGVGPEAGIKYKIGFTTETEPGWYMGGDCSAGLGPVGAYVEGGIQEHGPLGYGGGGYSPGLNLGCSGGVGWGW